MRYYKIIDHDYLIQIGTGFGGEEITAEEYRTIQEIIRTVPTAPEGCDYRLKADLTWELYELPALEEELTGEEALAIILGGEIR